MPAIAARITVPDASRRMLEELLSPAKAKTALSRAVARATAAATTQVRRVARAETNITQKYLGTKSTRRDEGVYSKVTRTPTGSEGIVIVNGRKLPLIAYGGRIVKASRSKTRSKINQGVTVSPDKLKAPIRIPTNVFKATMRGPLPSGVVSPGHTGYYRRRWQGSKPVGRLKVVEAFGPSLATLMRAAGRDVDIANIARDALDKTIKQQLKFLSGKIK